MSQLTIDVDEMLWHAWSRKSHCYVVKFRFTSLYDKMAAARVVLSDNMSQLHLKYIFIFLNYVNYANFDGHNFLKNSG